MPIVELRSTSNGISYYLSSSKPELIAVWLLETLERSKPQEWCPAQISFRPLWNQDPEHPNGVPDWSTDSVMTQDRLLVGGTGTEALHQLATELVNYADRIERERAEAAAQAAEAGEPV